MIYGIGTDICDIRRIRVSLARHGERFAEKILTANELATWRLRSTRMAAYSSATDNARGISYLATRFSAKEAFSKAVGLGMTMPMTWQSCEIINLSSGQPAIVLHGTMREWFEHRHLSAHLTMTDENEYAASFCVVEQHAPTPDPAPPSPSL